MWQKFYAKMHTARHLALPSSDALLTTSLSPFSPQLHKIRHGHRSWFSGTRSWAFLKKKCDTLRSRNGRSRPGTAENRTFPGTFAILGNFQKAFQCDPEFLKSVPAFLKNRNAFLPFQEKLLRSRSRSRTNGVYIRLFYPISHGSKCNYGPQTAISTGSYFQCFGGLPAPIYFRFFCLEPLKSLPQSCFTIS